MNAQSIVLQRQTKQRAEYKSDPARALIRKRARTVWSSDADALHGRVGFDYDGADWKFGIDRAVGGMHDAPNPAEMLCAALAACADASIRMIADMRGIRLQRLEVVVTGDVDVRGCLAIDGNVPVGFQALSCDVSIGVVPGTPSASVATLLLQAERACINLATLRSGAPVQFRHDAEVVDAVGSAEMR